MTEDLTSNIEAANAAADLATRRLVRRLASFVEPLEIMGERDMGLLAYHLATQFHGAVGQLRRLLDALESGEALKEERDADNYIGQAIAQYADDDCEIDDVPAVSFNDAGAWVAAWVWVSDEEAEAFSADPPPWATV